MDIQGVAPRVSDVTLSIYDATMPASRADNFQQREGCASKPATGDPLG